MSGVDVVAAFDFDGTLSPRDNFVPFLRRFAGTDRDGACVRDRRGAPGARPAGRTGAATASRRRCCDDLFAGRDVADLDDTAARVRRRRDPPPPARRGGRARRLAPHPGPPTRHRVGLARRLPPADRRVAPLRRRARDRARGRRRRPAHRAPWRAPTCGARRRRAGSTNGSPAPRRSCGPTATARATRSCGPAPIARSGSAAAPTAAPPDARRRLVFRGARAQRGPVV